jgi:hypothetical protein
MKSVFRVWLGVFLAFVLVCLFLGNATAEQCVVTEKQGTLLTLGCPGGVTRTENLGGRAENYQVGERIEFGSAQGGTKTIAPTDPRETIKPKSDLSPSPR